MKKNTICLGYEHDRRRSGSLLREDFSEAFYHDDLGPPHIHGSPELPVSSGTAKCRIPHPPFDI